MTMNTQTIRTVTKWLLLIALFVPMTGCAASRAKQLAKNRRVEHPVILFIGSSSIFFWNTLDNDFADVPGRFARNGRGSRTLHDVAANVQTEIVGLSPDKVLVYGGSIDLHEKEPRTPEQVFADFLSLCDEVHATLPKTTIYFISCKPSIAKWEGIEADVKLNGLIRQMAAHEPGVKYIDVFNPMLDSNGQPIPKLFAKDKNHLSRDGYALWTKIIRPYLIESN